MALSMKLESGIMVMLVQLSCANAQSHHQAAHRPDEGISAIAALAFAERVSPHFSPKTVYCITLIDSRGDRATLSEEVFQQLNGGKHLFATEEECRDTIDLSAPPQQSRRLVFLDLGPIERPSERVAFVSLSYGCGMYCGGSGMARVRSSPRGWIIDGMELQGFW